MNEKDLMLTDLDYAIGARRMQMLKAAIPYREISQQRALSMFIKWRELVPRRNISFSAAPCCLCKSPSSCSSFAIFSASF